LAGGFAAATVVYLAVSLFLFAAIAMSECLPRSDPVIHLCDAEKRREVLLYLVLFLVNPIITVLLIRRKTAASGLIYLTASSVLPFIAAMALGQIVWAFSR
jgi:hypothetical protein